MAVVSFSLLTRSIKLLTRGKTRRCSNCLNFGLHVLFNERLSLHERLELARMRTTKLLGVFTEAHQAYNEALKIPLCAKCGTNKLLLQHKTPKFIKAKLAETAVFRKRKYGGLLPDSDSDSDSESEHGPAKDNNKQDSEKDSSESDSEQ